MSAPAPQAQKKGGWMKAGIVGLLGLGGGAAGTYATAIVNTVVKPTKPVANFSLAAEGLSVSCQNHASGESGWWDFGDGTALEPFAPDQSVTHAYAKPGNYTVKLTVRNFLGDENERAVPVEVAPGAGGATAAPAPQVTGFAIVPVSPVAYAPATFRVTADVTNADRCVWDFGDGRVEVTDAGKIDRMVTFERAGTFPVQLFAHNGKQAVKQVGAVKIDAAPVGSVTAVLKVTDTGTQVTRLTRNESVAVPVPSGKNPPPGFSKPVHIRPGFAATEVAIVNPNVPGVKNLKVAVTPDGRSATITGEWAGDQKTVAKAAGGSDVIIPVKLTEERVAAVPPAVTMVTGTIGGFGGATRCDLPLPAPAAGLAGGKREYQIEIRQVGRDGKSIVAVQGPPNGAGAITFPWTGKVVGQGWSVIYSAALDGDRVVVTATQGGL